MIHKQLKIGGMTCVNCQSRIERKLRGAAGEMTEAGTCQYSCWMGMIHGTVFVTGADGAANVSAPAAARIFANWKADF